MMLESSQHLLATRLVYLCITQWKISERSSIPKKQVNTPQTATLTAPGRPSLSDLNLKGAETPAHVSTAWRGEAENDSQAWCRNKELASVWDDSTQQIQRTEECELKMRNLVGAGPGRAYGKDDRSQ